MQIKICHLRDPKTICFSFAVSFANKSQRTHKQGEMKNLMKNNVKDASGVKSKGK